MIYDLKGGFGTLRQINALYDDASNDSAQVQSRRVWNDRGLTTIKQQPIQQITYQQNLDLGLPTGQLRSSDVRYWSDFNRVFFHPRSIVQLSEYTLNDSIRPFENWEAGGELWRDVDRAEGGILDRDVRLFAEECDAMQGFQIFASTDDAWGGWTERYVDALRDEFGKKSLWVWGIEDEKVVQREKAIVRKANAAKSLAGIGDVVNAYTRLSTRPGRLPGYVLLDDGSEWEVTALLAAGVESVTLPTRLRAGAVRGATMPQLEDTLNTNQEQRVWELGLTMDRGDSQVAGPHTARGEVIETDTADDSKTYDISFTPESLSLLPNTLARLESSDARKHVFAQVDVTRKSKRLMIDSAVVRPLGLDELMRRRYNEEAVVERYAVPLSFPRLDAYPMSLFHIPEESVHSRELSLYSGLTTSYSTKQSILELRDLVTRHTRAIAVDEREDLYNNLTEIGEKYAFGWDSDVDSGED